MSSPDAPRQDVLESSATSAGHSATGHESAADRQQENPKTRIINPDWKGSLVEYFGPNESYCGYCKRHDNGRRSFDMQSHRLTVLDYQDLLDRGWRRSGKYCYCPNNRTICCPNYPIVCETASYRLTRSQRRCIENMNSFLATGSIKDRVRLNYTTTSVTIDEDKSESPVGLIRGKTFDLLKSSLKLRDKRLVRSCERKVRLNDISLETAIEQIKKKHKTKQVKQASLENYLYPRISSLPNRQEHQTNDENFKPKHSLRIRMCYVKSELSEGSREEEHAIIVRYQRAVHGEERHEWTMTRYRDFLVDSPLIRAPLKGYDYLEESQNLSDQDQEAAAWAVDVNSNDSLNDKFLLIKPPELPSAYGTYHCNYYLDDKLIAVGVLDVLPKSITTVYFFYDPDYAFLNLGIYSALVEISMIRQMCQHYSGDTTGTENQLIYYHLGFYVHESKKMHYKTRFEPSYLLCSKSLRYVPTKVCLAKLKDKKFAVFSDEPLQEPQMPSLMGKLFAIPIYSPITSDNRTLIHYINWLETRLGYQYVELLIDGYLATYIRLVGPELINRICLRLNTVHRSLLDRHLEATRRPLDI